MDSKRRNWVVYGLLLTVWLLVVAWQVQEHERVKESAKTDLRYRSKAIANTLGAVIGALQFRGHVLQQRLEPVLQELVNDRTNRLVNSSELVSIVLLNSQGDQVAAAGAPIDLTQKGIMQQGEHWGPKTVVFVNPIQGANLRREGSTNAPVLLPPFRQFGETNRDHGRGRFHRDRRPDGPPPGPPRAGGPNARHRAEAGSTNLDPGRDRGGRRPPRDFGPGRRPFWLRWMSDQEYAKYQAMVKKRELHGLVLAMSTKNYRALCVHDLWLRYIIAFFAGISAAGVGLAWGNLSKSSQLQIRLVRASEMNTHLKEMNLAAAGLAHETRNPLNIIRGLAQLISKQPDTPPEIRTKSREIVDETDKVTAQLNEFINYSRPREIRRSVVVLHNVVSEVVRALNYDIEEKKLQVEIKDEPFAIEADEQQLRQVLFNLVLNAIQAVGEGGEIQIVARRPDTNEATLEVRDNGPGVPPARREEIFKPYFTTQQKGTGLGLAIVQQMVLAHGWEIQCLSNQPKGAVFRIVHLKLAPMPKH